MNTPQRRRFLRYDVNASVELAWDGRTYRCETEDLGAGGCRVVLPIALTKGGRVELALSSARSAVTVRGLATVAWATQDLPCRVGLAFSDELSETVIPFMHALLGGVGIRCA